MIVILHSGQTGVERGAHRGATSAGLQIAGFMPLDRRDEFGAIPTDVAQHLTPCLERGPRPAVRANVQIASGVLLVVPDAATPEKFTAMSNVLQGIRSTRVPSLVCDPLMSSEIVRRWAISLPETAGSTRICVTGPRSTRWQEGETLARRLTAAIGIGS